ncbi:MAG: RNA polymerase sigma factor [Planctomycetota bacterium]|jgi:RNA polymerase sigma-70 factor (ECF subfamily)
MDIDLEIIAISKAKQGDKEAWRTLFDQHFEPMWCFCLHLANGRADIAEEISQQVFVAAAKSIHKFNDEHGTFRSWLFGIAKKRLAKLKTKEVIQKSHELKISKANIEVPRADDKHMQVYETLAKLPGHYRDVLEAKYMEKLTVNDIADARGKTPKAIEALLVRAREKFAQVHKGLHDKEEL